MFLDDLRATLDRDPAATNALEVILTYSGFHAVFWHRVAHRLYHWGFPFLPRMISQVSRFFTGVEIHPAAEIGGGFFIDHGTGVVIGETSIIGDDVTLFQGVTLGGTGKERGKRHPTLGDRVVVGAGAKILGDITVGDDVYVGANAVVLRDVPKNSTVVGIPGRVARREGRRVPSVTLDHIHVPDPIARELESLNREIKRIEEYIRKTGGDLQVSFLEEGAEEEAAEPEEGPAGGESETGESATVGSAGGDEATARTAGDAAEEEAPTREDVEPGSKTRRPDEEIEKE
ncbi:MAG: serine O-acetyltransferase [Candidatus Eiseniibacteriota bacterium]|nr:MAG: serine O-acetyltransferase [Candidatus Eisenbacteria bacterium]